MKIDHEIKDVGELKKIIVKVNDDSGKPVDEDISILIKSPDGLESIFMPPASVIRGEKTHDEKSIYNENKDMPSNLVSRIDKGVYSIVYVHSSEGEHEGIVMIFKDSEDEEFETHKFKFSI